MRQFGRPEIRGIVANWFPLYICRSCSHVAEIDIWLRCMFCGSSKTGILQQRNGFVRGRRLGIGKTQEAQHDAARQAQYPIHYRLTRGFAIMGGGSV